MNFNLATDGELLHKFAATGDQAIFNELVQRHWSLVWRSCRRLAASHHDAEDAAQAVFTLLSERASQLTEHRCLAGWLYSTAWHIATKQRRTRQRERRRELVAASLDVASEPPAPESDEFVQALHRAIEMLPPQYREAIVLHHLQGLRLQEVADLLGVPLGTIAARVSRGRAMLRERLRGDISLSVFGILDALEIEARFDPHRPVPTERRIGQAAASVAAPATARTAAQLAAVWSPAAAATATAGAVSSTAAALSPAERFLNALLNLFLQCRVATTATVLLAVTFGSASAVQHYAHQRRQSYASVGADRSFGGSSSNDGDSESSAAIDSSLRHVSESSTGGRGGSVRAVPEPSTAAIMGGAAGWILMRRKQRPDQG